MLTKAHLRFRIRNGKATPVLLASDDQRALGLGRQLIGVFSSSIGLTFGELDEALYDVADSSALRDGLQKLLMDRCQEEDDDGSVGKRRLDYLQLAEKLRTTGQSIDIDEFRGSLSDAAGHEFAKLRADLYADLPARRRLAVFPELSPLQLLHRYNCAQIQGLLLRARTVKIGIGGGGLAGRRKFFQSLKFHRLLAEVSSGASGERFTVEIGGPLSIFQNVQSYGLRLANFFPHVLNFPKWELAAEVNLKNKWVSLALDDGIGLLGHYDDRRPYVPSELTAFIKKFNDKSTGWQAVPEGDFVNIGRQSYCFPDVTFVHVDGDRRYLELFHRWHAGTLVNRLKALEKNPIPDLVLGVSRNLQKDKKIAKLVTESAWFQTHGFIFKDFPTSKAVLGLLTEKKRV